MNFNTYSFKELLTDIVDNRGKTCPVEESGMPLIATNCIKENTLYPVFEKVRYVSDNTYKTWFRGHPKSGDMIFVCKGSPGRVNWVPDPVSFCIAQDMVSIRADETKVYPKYLFALLRSKGTQQKILNMHVGTLIPHFKKGDFGNLYFDIPDEMDYQKKVGDAYFDFCLKIEANSQLNQTLEEMAQAIFKSWFVDFDPVKANMNGELPEGMDAATASLFPEKLVESELGMVPEGWEASSMGEHFNITMGQSPKGETYNEDGEGIAFFQGRRDFGFRYPDVRVFTTDPKRYAKAGDTLISVRAPVGDKNMAAIDCCIGRGVGAIKHKSDSRSFTYAFVSHIEKKLGDSGSSGTVFSSINQKELKKVSFVAPPQELVEAFHNLVDPIDQKVEVLSKEIDSLSQLRDTLLPKLLSGEIELETAIEN